MRASRDELPELFGPAIRGADWGDLRTTVVSMPAGTDARPLFKGLPDDRCPAPHWGYVIKGRIRIIYADREEVLRAATSTTSRPATPPSSKRISNRPSSARPRPMNRCSTSSSATLRRRQSQPDPHRGHVGHDAGPIGNVANGNACFDAAAAASGRRCSGYDRSHRGPRRSDQHCTGGRSGYARAVGSRGVGRRRPVRRSVRARHRLLLATTNGSRRPRTDAHRGRGARLVSRAARHRPGADGAPPQSDDTRRAARATHRYNASPSATWCSKGYATARRAITWSRSPASA